MLFVNWWLVGEATLALLMIASGVIGFAKAGKLSGRMGDLESVPYVACGRGGHTPWIASDAYDRVWM